MQTYFPYLEAVSYIRNLKARHAVVTETHLKYLIWMNLQTYILQRFYGRVYVRMIV